MSIYRHYFSIFVGVLVLMTVFILWPSQAQASAAYAMNAADTTPPVMGGTNPVANQTNVVFNSNIAIQITDDESGVDPDTLVLTVNGVIASPSRITRTGVSTDTVFTYNPPVDFDQPSTVTVNVEVKDVAGNSMSPQTFSFGVMDVDTTPPVISNIQCIPNANYLTIIWDTDEPARSVVNYGETNSLGSFVSKSFPVTTRTMLLTGLAPSTLYHYQVASTDISGNMANSAILTCTTINATSLQSDDFNSCELNNYWSYIDPVGDVTMTATGTQIKFDVPAGASHDTWSTGNNGARIMQGANDTLFEVEALFETGLSAQNQTQGMIIEQDSDTYLRVNFRIDSASNPRIEVYLIDGTTTPVEVLSRPIPSAAAPMYMRLWRRTASEWTLFYTVDVDEQSAQPGGYKFTQALNVANVGVFAGNAGGTSAPAFTSIIDYFFRHDLPISPEDGTALELEVNASPIEAGTVTKSVSCGNPVELTAVPAPGWRFDSWTSVQGSVADSENPVEVSFPYNEVVTANFVQDFYTITTSIVDGLDGQTGGSVTLSTPASGEGYELDEVATVTALASPGWQFDGWGGDASGTDPMLSFTMTTNLNVIANFSRIPYAVDITVDGQGSVTSVPASGPYYLNDVVSLTAVAQPGWTFALWSGDIDSSNASESIIVDGNKSVTATFTQDQYALSVSMDGTGSGSVTVSPEQATYLYGDVVTLTALANPGSTFAGWSGAGLTGSAMTETLTMQQPELVVATFTQDFYVVSAGATENGSIVFSDPNVEDGYVYGELVVVTALPATDCTFQAWTGSLSGTTTPEFLTVTGNHTVGAIFSCSPGEPTTYYTLTVTASAGGTVLPISGVYEAGTTVILSAMPDEGFAFVNWTDANGTVLNEATTWPVQMNSERTIVANFEPIAPGEFTLVKRVVGDGSIMSNPTGGSFPEGAAISLVAMPDLGWSFSGWSGDVTSVSATTTLTISANSIVTATFTQDKYTVSTAVVGNGTATVSQPMNADGYVYDEEITLTAVADSGWIFGGWESSEGAVTSDNPVTVAVKGNVTFTATFTAIPVEEDNTVSGVSFGVTGQGEVQVLPNKTTYTKDEVITLTAVPLTGWRFVGWESNVLPASGSVSDATITVKAANNMNVKAIFEEIPPVGTTEDDDKFIFLPFINS